MKTENITRRSALAGLAAVAPAATAAALPAIGDDAELIFLGRRFDELWAIEKTMDAIAEGFPYAGDTYTPEEQEAAGNADGAWQDVLDIIREIIVVPAHTPAGLRVKARAAWWMIRGEAEDYGAGDLRDGDRIIRDGDLLFLLLKDIVPESLPARTAPPFSPPAAPEHETFLGRVEKIIKVLRGNDRFGVPGKLDQQTGQALLAAARRLAGRRNIDFYDKDMKLIYDVLCKKNGQCLDFILAGDVGGLIAAAARNPLAPEAAARRPRDMI